MNKFEAAMNKAKDEGHELEHDPPANSFASVDRYTCKKCGKAVLGNYSTAYGAATEATCSGSS